MKKLLTLAAMLALLYLAPESKADEPEKASQNFAQATFGYNIHKNIPSLRMEGEAIFPFGLDVYGIITLDAVKDSTNLENYFSEIMASYMIGPLGILAHHQSGNGIDDLIRGGIIGVPDISENTLLKVWLTPANTKGANAQAGLLAYQRNIIGGLSADVFAEYNFDYKGNTSDLYTEIGAYYNVFGGMNIGIQERMLFDFKNDFRDLNALGVIKYVF